MRLDTDDIFSDELFSFMDGMNEHGFPEAKIREIGPEKSRKLLQKLKTRFEANMPRHPNMDWHKVKERLEAKRERIWSLNEMELTGGEPDVVGFDEKIGEFVFFDCSAESPEGRRMLCYDHEGQKSAKKQGFQPAWNAVDVALAMGIEILTEDEYLKLQTLGKFDSHTWSWLNPKVKSNDERALLGYLYRNETVIVESHPTFSHTQIGGFRGSLRV